MRFLVSDTDDLRKIKIYSVLPGGVESITFFVVTSPSQVLYYLS